MDFVIIANAWGAATDNPTSKHQIALELARKGHRVLWLEGAGMRRPSLGSGSDRGRIVRKLVAACRGPRRVAPGIHVVTPLLVPLPNIRWIRFLNSRIYHWVARIWGRVLGFSKPVLINYVPVLAQSMSRWPGKVVYHCVDLWSAFDMYDSNMMAEMDRLCCNYAGLVITTSQDLYERCCAHHGNVKLINHGVSYEHFRESVEPRMDTNGHEYGGSAFEMVGGISNADARENSDHADHDGEQLLTTNNDSQVTCPRGPRSIVYSQRQRPKDMPDGPIVGFFGLISEWVDQELLVKLADALPDAQVVLIGKADVPIAQLQTRENIHILGARPFSDLPSYVAHFTVGIIPFVVNALTRAVNPIKLREMLAGGCPVVSTPLPEVATWGEAVSECQIAVAEGDEAFIDGVREFVSHPLTLERRRVLSKRMVSESWSAKVDEMLAAIEGVS